MSAERAGDQAPAALADTSVFIARESGRRLEGLPGRIALSVVTVGELQLGVLLAEDRRTRALRGATLDLARRSDPIPLTEAIMESWAAIAQACMTSGAGKLVRTFDALIAATALVHGLPVVTQDNDFDQIRAAEPRLDVIKV